MKAVDFIVELQDRYIFIEFKDPMDPHARDRDRNPWIDQFQNGKIDEDFKYKYRDSFLYTWALEQTTKPIYYYILIALDTLTEADLLVRSDALKRALPVEGPSSGVWRRRIVAGCSVFNISSWNRLLSDYPVSRE